MKIPNDLGLLPSPPSSLDERMEQTRAAGSA